MKNSILFRHVHVLLILLCAVFFMACRNPVVSSEESPSGENSGETVESDAGGEPGEFSGMEAADTETDGANIWNITGGDRSLVVTDNYTVTDFSVAVVNGNIEIDIRNGGNELWKVQLLEELDKLTTGTEYVLSFTAKASAGYDISASMEFAQIWDENPENIVQEVSIAESDYSLTTDFQTFSLDFTAIDDPADGVNRSEVIKVNLGNIEDVTVTISSITLTEAE